MDLLKIYRCYKEDKDHIDKDHEKSGLGINECVKHTFSVLKNDKAKIFEVKDIENNLIGLCSQTDNNLMQFWFIYPKFRNEYFCKLFWGKVLSIFNGIIYTAVNKKNEKALKHLMKNNFKIINENNNLKFLKCL